MTNLVTLFDTSKPFPYFFETRAQIVCIIIAGKTIVCVGAGGHGATSEILKNKR